MACVATVEPSAITTPSYSHQEGSRDPAPFGLGRGSRFGEPAQRFHLQMTERSHFTFRVDTWTPDGESVVEHVAGIEDYQLALATFRAACPRWPGISLTLRQAP